MWKLATRRMRWILDDHDHDFLNYPTKNKINTADAQLSKYFD
jgi:hypothetical protein